jgi:hypothetical protein
MGTERKYGVEMQVSLAELAAQAAASTSVWSVLGCVAAAGAIGGVVNALLSDNTIIIPKEKAGILRPGVLGNIFLGAFGAVVSWGLYGPLKDSVLIGPRPGGEVSANLTVTALVGAALAGVGGARIITSEVDKRYLRNAGVQAATKPADSDLAAKLRTVSPSNAAVAAALGAPGDRLHGGSAVAHTSSSVPGPSAEGAAFSRPPRGDV